MSPTQSQASCTVVLVARCRPWMKRMREATMSYRVLLHCSGVDCCNKTVQLRRRLAYVLTNSRHVYKSGMREPIELIYRCQVAIVLADSSHGTYSSMSLIWQNMLSTKVKAFHNFSITMPSFPVKHRVLESPTVKKSTSRYRL